MSLRKAWQTFEDASDVDFYSLDVQRAEDVSQGEFLVSNIMDVRMSFQALFETEVRTQFQNRLLLVRGEMPESVIKIDSISSVYGKLIGDKVERGCVNRLADVIGLVEGYEQDVRDFWQFLRSFIQKAVQYSSEIKKDTEEEGNRVMSEEQVVWRGKEEAWKIWTIQGAYSLLFEDISESIPSVILKDMVKLEVRIEWIRNCLKGSDVPLFAINDEEKIIWYQLLRSTERSYMLEYHYGLHMMAVLVRDVVPAGTQDCQAWIEYFYGQVQTPRNWMLNEQRLLLGLSISSEYLSGIDSLVIDSAFKEVVKTRHGAQDSDDNPFANRWDGFLGFIEEVFQREWRVPIFRSFLMLAWGNALAKTAGVRQLKGLKSSRGLTSSTTDGLVVAESWANDGVESFSWLYALLDRRAKVDLYNTSTSSVLLCQEELTEISFSSVEDECLYKNLWKWVESLAGPFIYHHVEQRVVLATLSGLEGWLDKLRQRDGISIQYYSGFQENYNFTYSSGSEPRDQSNLNISTDSLVDPMENFPSQLSFYRPTVPSDFYYEHFVLLIRSIYQDSDSLNAVMGRDGNETRCNIVISSDFWRRGAGSRWMHTVLMESSCPRTLLNELEALKSVLVHDAGPLSLQIYRLLEERDLLGESPKTDGKMLARRGMEISGTKMDLAAESSLMAANMLTGRLHQKWMSVLLVCATMNNQVRVCLWDNPRWSSIFRQWWSSLHSLDHTLTVAVMDYIAIHPIDSLVLDQRLWDRCIGLSDLRLTSKILASGVPIEGLEKAWSLVRSLFARKSLSEISMDEWRFLSSLFSKRLPENLSGLAELALPVMALNPYTVQSLNHPCLQAIYNALSLIRTLPDPRTLFSSAEFLQNTFTWMLLPHLTDTLFIERYLCIRNCRRSSTVLSPSLPSPTVGLIAGVAATVALKVCGSPLFKERLEALVCVDHGWVELLPMALSCPVMVPYFEAPCITTDSLLIVPRYENDCMNGPNKNDNPTLDKTSIEADKRIVPTMTPLADVVKQWLYSVTDTCILDWLHASVNLWHALLSSSTDCEISAGIIRKSIHKSDSLKSIVLNQPNFDLIKRVLSHSQESITGVCHTLSLLDSHLECFRIMNTDDSAVVKATENAKAGVSSHLYLNQEILSTLLSFLLSVQLGDHCHDEIVLESFMGNTMDFTVQLYGSSFYNVNAVMTLLAARRSSERGFVANYQSRQDSLLRDQAVVLKCLDANAFHLILYLLRRCFQSISDLLVNASKLSLTKNPYSSSHPDLSAHMDSLSSVVLAISETKQSTLLVPLMAILSQVNSSIVLEDTMPLWFDPLHASCAQLWKTSDPSRSYLYALVLKNYSSSNSFGSLPLFTECLIQDIFYGSDARLFSLASSLYTLIHVKGNILHPDAQMQAHSSGQQMMVPILKSPFLGSADYCQFLASFIVTNEQLETLLDAGFFYSLIRHVLAFPTDTRHFLNLLWRLNDQFKNALLATKSAKSLVDNPSILTSFFESCKDHSIHGLYSGDVAMNHSLRATLLLLSYLGAHVHLDMWSTFLSSFCGRIVAPLLPTALLAHRQGKAVPLDAFLLLIATVMSLDPSSLPFALEMFQYLPIDEVNGSTINSNVSEDPSRISLIRKVSLADFAHFIQDSLSDAHFRPIDADLIALSVHLFGLHLAKAPSALYTHFSDWVHKAGLATHPLFASFIH